MKHRKEAAMDKTYYIVRTLGFWGRGDTPQEAALLDKVIQPADAKEKPYVDGYGATNHYGVSERLKEGKLKALLY